MTRTIKQLSDSGRLALGWVALVLACLLPPPALAQSGIGDIIYTVGTTARDPHGRDWACIHPLAEHQPQPDEQSCFCRLSKARRSHEPGAFHPALVGSPADRSARD